MSCGTIFAILFRAALETLRGAPCPFSPLLRETGMLAKMWGFVKVLSWICPLSFHYKGSENIPQAQRLLFTRARLIVMQFARCPEGSVMLGFSLTPFAVRTSRVTPLILDLRDSLLVSPPRFFMADSPPPHVKVEYLWIRNNFPEISEFITEFAICFNI